MGHQVCYPDEDRAKPGPMDYLMGAPSQEKDLIWTLRDTKEDGPIKPTTGICPTYPGLTPVFLSHHKGLVQSKSALVCMCGLTQLTQHRAQRPGFPHLQSVPSQLIIHDNQALQALHTALYWHLPLSPDSEYLSSPQLEIREGLNGMGDV